MTAKQIVKEVLEKAEFNNYTAYELGNKIYGQLNRAVPDSTVRRTIRDLRNEGVDIRTKNVGGRTRAYFLAR